MTRPLLPGVYVPTMCFFEEDTENVDTAQPLLATPFGWPELA